MEFGTYGTIQKKYWLVLNDQLHKSAKVFLALFFISITITFISIVKCKNYT